LCFEMAEGMEAASMPDENLSMPSVLYMDLYPYGLFLWRSDMDIFMRNMERYRQLAKKPFYEVQNELKSLPKIRGEGGIMAKILTPHFSGQWPVFSNADAAHRLSILAVAMEKHRLIHGTYPDSLAALDIEEGYDIQIDPFTGKLMKISVNNAGHKILYSLGPDMKDDGGHELMQKDNLTYDGDIAIILSK
jgi:hypothetical protein